MYYIGHFVIKRFNEFEFRHSNFVFILILLCVTAAGIIYISFFMAQFLNANTGDPFESVYVCVHNYVEVSLWSID